MIQHGPALYEMLTGQFADGTDIESLNPAMQLSRSVADNVARILNARSGALKHIPSYGLPDLTQVYRHLPASAHELKRMIESTLLAHEPRLQAIEVELGTNDDTTLLNYVLHCKVKGLSSLILEANFLPAGQIRIKTLKLS